MLKRFIIHRDCLAMNQLRVLRAKIQNFTTQFKTKEEVKMFTQGHQ